MPYRICILTPAEAPCFSQMTFPAYHALLGGRSLAIGAYVDDNPAGMALLGVSGEASGSPDRAELLSLFVDQSHRQHGLGTLLLRHAEKTLETTKISTIHTTWSETMAGAVPFRAVLAKCGWAAPYERLFLLRGDMSGKFGRGIRRDGPKYQSPNYLPSSYAMTPWHEMTGQDRTFIRSKEGQANWYPPRATPFREEKSMKPGVAMVLRKDGMDGKDSKKGKHSEIVGWITVHQTAPDTLRYTDVFIRTDLRRAGAVIIGMLIHCFWLHMADGTPKLTWGIEADNKPLMTMCKTRLLDFSHQSWTWGAEKQL